MNTENLPEEDLDMPGLENEQSMNDFVMRPFTEPGKWNTELPDELERFFVQNDIREKFTIILKKFDGSAPVGSSVTCKDFVNMIPTNEYMAQIWGPGCYQMLVTYKKRRPNGQLEAKNSMTPYTVRLEGDYYEKLYDEYQAVEEERRLKRLEKQQSARAIREKYRFGSGDPLNSVSKSIEALTPILQLTRQDNSGTTELLKALIAANTSKGGDDGSMKMMMLMMNQQAEASREASRNQTAMMLGLVQTLAPLLLGRPQATDGFGGAGLEKILSITERIQGMINPPVKTFSDRIFDILEEWAPAIMKIVQTPPSERGMMDKMLIARVKKSQELARLSGERESLVNVVNRMDEKYGTKVADQIIAGLGLKRPEETADNYNKFPAVTAEAEAAAAEGEDAAADPAGDGGAETEN